MQLTGAAQALVKSNANLGICSETSQLNVLSDPKSEDAGTQTDAATIGP